MAETPEDLWQRMTPEQRAKAEQLMFGGRRAKQAPEPVAPVAPPMPPAQQPQAVEQAPQPDIPKIKRNIKRLMQQNAPEEDIDTYVASEGVTIDQLKAHKSELSWSDVPSKAWDNAGESAARTAYAMVYPFLHPVDTANALGNIAYGAGSKIAGAVGVEQDPEAKAQNEAHINAVGQYFVDRYGSLDALKQSLAKDPVGVMADAATVLSGGGMIAARAPGVVGKVGQAAAAAGSAIDPLANVGRAVTAAGKGTAAVLGTTSGVGQAPVEAAFKAGLNGSKTFTENMRGQAPITDTLDMARSAMGDLRKERSAAYEQGMLNVGANMKPLDLRPVAKSVEDAARMVYVDGGNGKRFSKSAEAADTVKKMAAKLEEFNNLGRASHTAQSVDGLKQAIGEIRQGTEHGTVSRTVADKVYNSVKDQIVKQVPDYAATMRGYSQASDQLDDLSKTFSLGENAAKDTSIRKLTSVMRNNVNTNYGRRQQLMDVLAEKQPELPYAVAGQAMSSLEPRGLSKISAYLTGAAGMATMNPLAIPGLAAASPRIVGEVAHAAGKSAGAVKKIADAFKVDLKTARKIMQGSYAVNQAGQPVLIGSQTSDYPAP